MFDFTYRLVKGSPLTWSELDGNFQKIAGQAITKEELATPDGSSLVGYQGGSVKDALDESKFVSQSIIENQKRTPLNYATFAEATSAAEFLINGQEIESPDSDGHLSIFEVQDGNLIFKDFAPDAILIQSYTSLRAYTGKSNAIDITTPGIAGRFYRDDTDVTTPDNGGVVIVDASGRRWVRSNSGNVKVKWFGAKGNYVADDTTPIVSAFNYCASTGRTLEFDTGTYRVTQSLRKPSGFKIVGAGKPNFNLTVGNDDKSFLRPGYKHLLPGSSIIWSGSQTETISMPRTDGWSSFGYMLSTPFLEPDQISEIGLICDVDCFDAAGNLTTPSTDNRAAYDVGLAVDNSMDCQFTEIAIFGYFQKKKGLVVCVRDLALANPDYNYFTNCTIFGGSALIGYQGSPNAGLSGTMFLGCSQYDQTYHNRSAIGATDYIGQSVLYVDGQVSTGTAISGVMIIGGGLRGQCPDPIQLDKVNGITFGPVTTEFSLNPAYTGQTLKYISGTANTERVVFAGSRTFGSAWAIALRSLQSAIKGPLVVDENFAGMSYLFKNGMGVAYGPSDELGGDPVLQLTRAGGTSATQGWNVRHTSTGDLSFRYNGVTQAVLSPLGVLGVTSAVGKSSGSSAGAPALLPYSLDPASGFYRAPSLIGISIDGSPAGVWTSGSYRPGANNTQSLGLPGTQWSNVHSRNVTLTPASSVIPANNGEMTFELTSDTQLKVKVKGSDGVVRSSTLTLA